MLSDCLYLQRNGSIANSRKLVNYLDGLEAYFDRYYFCKEHNMPFNVDIMMSQYCGIRNNRESVYKEDKQRIERIMQEYKVIFASAPQNNTIKRKLWFYFNKTYTFLYNIKETIIEKSSK